MEVEPGLCHVNRVHGLDARGHADLTTPADPHVDPLGPEEVPLLDDVGCLGGDRVAGHAHVVGSLARDLDRRTTVLGEDGAKQEEEETAGKDRGHALHDVVVDVDTHEGRRLASPGTPPGQHQRGQGE